MWTAKRKRGDADGVDGAASVAIIEPGDEDGVTKDY